MAKKKEAVSNKEFAAQVLTNVTEFTDRLEEARMEAVRAEERLEYAQAVAQTCKQEYEDMLALAIAIAAGVPVPTDLKGAKDSDKMTAQERARANEFKSLIGMPETKKEKAATNVKESLAPVKAKKVVSQPSEITTKAAAFAVMAAADDDIAPVGTNKGKNKPKAAPNAPATPKSKTKDRAMILVRQLPLACPGKYNRETLLAEVMKQFPDADPKKVKERITIYLSPSCGYLVADAKGMISWGTGEARSKKK